MMFKRFFKYLWRWYNSIKLRKRNVVVYPETYFNRQTDFEGNNVIHPHTVVSGCLIGRNTYIGPRSFMPKCKIGRFCSIASDVKVVTGKHPTSVFVSTCPSFFSAAMQNGQTFVRNNKFDEQALVEGYNIVVGNDVWIGSQVVLRGGKYW